MSELKQNPFHQWIRLEQPRLGTRVVYASDDFFADKSRLIDAADPVFVPDKYDDNGKWMDGWESRRKRVEGHDDCIVRLGVPGIIRGVDIDTRHFTGNYPPAASIEACVSDADIPPDETAWIELLPSVDLQCDSHHYHSISNDQVFTHLRLHIYPDGGVARLRIYGEVEANVVALLAANECDLLALSSGGRALACSDEHFGSMHNLNLPDRGINMGDGWETARRRGPGNDWVVLALGHPGAIDNIEVDTAYFKGNYPDSVSIQAALVDDSNAASIVDDSAGWDELLPRQKLQMDEQHYFNDELNDLGRISHVRMSIFPDGGVSRLRLNGKAVG